MPSSAPAAIRDDHVDRTALDEQQVRDALPECRIGVAAAAAWRARVGDLAELRAALTRVAATGRILRDDDGRWIAWDRRIKIVTDADATTVLAAFVLPSTTVVDVREALRNTPLLFTPAVVDDLRERFGDRWEGTVTAHIRAMASHGIVAWRDDSPNGGWRVAAAGDVVLLSADAKVVLRFWTPRRGGQHIVPADELRARLLERRVAPSRALLEVASLATLDDPTRWLLDRFAHVAADATITPHEQGAHRGYWVRTTDHDLLVSADGEKVVSARFGTPCDPAIVRDRALVGTLGIDPELVAELETTLPGVDAACYVSRFVASLAQSEPTWHGFWLFGDRRHGAVVTEDGRCVRRVNLGAPGDNAEALAFVRSGRLHVPEHVAASLAGAYGPRWRDALRDAVSVTARGRVGSISGPRGGWHIQLRGGVTAHADPTCSQLRRVRFERPPDFSPVAAALSARTATSAVDVELLVRRLPVDALVGRDPLAAAVDYVAGMLADGATTRWDVTRQSWSIEHPCGHRAAVRADGALLALAPAGTLPRDRREPAVS